MSSKKSAKKKTSKSKAAQGRSKDAKKIDLHSLFLGLQNTMTAELENFRHHISHPTDKGDGSEDCWLEMLRKYLPSRYQVDKATVLDYNGNVSDAIDIVLYDQQYSPFLFEKRGVKYVPAESVYAVIEVKQELNRDYILYAGAKAESVRRLGRTSAEIPHAGGMYPPKPLHRIPAGIVTLDPGWNPALGKPFTQAIKDLDKEEQLDFGCVLNGGSFSCIYGSAAGDVAIKTSTTEDSLITFFLQLIKELQKFGTAPAIDMAQWSKTLSLNI